MRVGITIRTGKKQNVWNGGLVQNIYNLACCLEKIPFVEDVVLINRGDHAEHPCGARALGERFPLLSANDAGEYLDVAIEAAGYLEAEWMRRFRARGGRTVLFSRDQPYGGLVESSVFERGGYAGEIRQFDEVWVLPKDASFAKILEAMYRCPAHEVPFLWSPYFLERSADKLPDGSWSFGYVPGGLSIGSIRAAIFEPNISSTKMGLIPLLICEEAERTISNAIASVDFLNGQHMASQTSFIFFMQNLGLYNSGRVRIHERDYFARIMGQGGNVVVSHQIDCAQNYLYLDALYGGYPLIHNSEFFTDIGYYYPSSDVSAGAAALIEAARHHDGCLEEYTRRGKAKLNAYSPAERQNLNEYARRLVCLTSGFSARRNA